ncbi:MAG: MaoC family dehydratase [Chloroflexi bacterium]|nr:MaoC family dehydratase [Chloroflexota bacterium]
MLPEEVTKFIGKSTGVVVCEVEKGAVKKFADAVDDPTPFYWDEKYARNSKSIYVKISPIILFRYLCSSSSEFASAR